jgi:hypothetical protein
MKKQTIVKRVDEIKKIILRNNTELSKGIRFELIDDVIYKGNKKLIVKYPLTTIIHFSSREFTDLSKLGYRSIVVWFWGDHDDSNGCKLINSFMKVDIRLHKTNTSKRGLKIIKLPFPEDRWSL